jgi:hypothetical protein
MCVFTYVTLVVDFVAIFVIVALSALVFPIRFLVDITHDVSSSIASIAFAIAALASLGMLFGQKVLRILNISPANKKIHTKVSDDKTAAGANYAVADSQQADNYAMLTTDEERFDYCRRKIIKWQSRMFALNSDQSVTDISRSELVGRMLAVNIELSATEYSKSERVSSGGGNSTSTLDAGRLGLQDDSASQDPTRPSIAPQEGVIEQP